MTLFFKKLTTTGNCLAQVFPEGDSPKLLGVPLLNKKIATGSFTINNTTNISVVAKGYDGVYRIIIEKANENTEWEPYYVTSSTTVTQEKNHTLTAIWQKN